MFYNFLRIQYLLGRITAAQLDTQVTAGRLTAEQAAEIKALVTTATTATTAAGSTAAATTTTAGATA